MKDNHRYIFANYVAKPRNPKRTHEKGYMSDPNNVMHDEIVGFSVGLKNKDLIRNRIVIDIDGQRVVHNSMGNNADWVQIMDYFMGAYERQILEFLKRTGGAPKNENSV